MFDDVYSQDEAHASDGEESYAEEDQRQHTDNSRNNAPPPRVPSLGTSGARESYKMNPSQQLEDMKQQNLHLNTKMNDLLKKYENLEKDYRTISDENQRLKNQLADFMAGYHTPYDAQSHTSVESLSRFITPPPMSNPMQMFGPQMIPQSPQVTGIAMPNGLPPPQNAQNQQPYVEPFYGPFHQQGYPSPGFPQGPFTQVPFPPGPGGPPQFAPMGYTTFAHSQPNQFMGSQPNSVSSFTSFGQQLHVLPSSAQV